MPFSDKELKPIEKLVSGSAFVPTPIGSPGEWWYVIMTGEDCFVAVAGCVLVFSTKQRAHLLLEKHAEWKEEGHRVLRIRWGTLVKKLDLVCKQAALDWRGPYEGFYKHGGRYTLR